MVLNWRWYKKAVTLFQHIKDAILILKYQQYSYNFYGALLKYCRACKLFEKAVQALRKIDLLLFHQQIIFLPWLK